MSLDLSKVAPQVDGMMSQLKAGAAEKQERLKSALSVVSDSSINLEALRAKINASRGKTTWLVAGLLEGFNNKYAAPQPPSDFTVLATDGSHIDIDRHRAARCFLINIGTVVLSYGAGAGAALDSFPYLCSEESGLLIKPPDGKGREQAIEGPLLGIKRAVEECRWLADLAAELPTERRALALLDGSLILWGLEANKYPEFVSDILLEKDFLVSLDKLRKLSGDRLATASYISLPRSTDVINALRVAVCPHEIPDCDRYCTANGKHECDNVAGIQDRDLFFELLAPGERSAVFTSPSSVVLNKYGGHQVYFFYLRLEEEIARLEVPQWVAENPRLLDLTHSLALDQCRRGQGYPVALSEAHEQAVVTGADRELFWQFIEAELAGEHIQSYGSAKSQSKRTRWV